MHRNPHAPEDDFLQTVPGSVALELALRGGLLDRIALLGPIEVQSLPEEIGAGCHLPLLQRAGVITVFEGSIALAPEFAAIWPERRHALTHKLRFLKIAMVDLSMGYADMVSDLPRFMSQSHTFDFFDYSSAMTLEPQALARTEVWCDYLAALTETEAGTIADLLAFDPGARVLEIGGNVGVMAHALMEAHGLDVTVLDLPAVCALGEKRNADRASGARPTFVSGDAREGEWNELAGAPWDGVMFKSVLHDWPEDARRALLDHAAVCLSSGGQIVIAERGPVEASGDMPFWMTADLVFAPFYLPSSYYEDALRERGFSTVCHHPELGLPFQVIVGTKE